MGIARGRMQLDSMILADGRGTETGSLLPVCSKFRKIFFSWQVATLLYTNHLLGLQLPY
jgi:hypothetical protein